MSVAAHTGEVMTAVRDATITSFPGLRCASGSIGIKRDGAADAALFVLERPAVYAGVFTTNRFRSACVESAAERLHAGRPIRAVLITSGNANAGTGLEGRADTEMLAAAVGGALGVPADQAIVLHTGVIGVPLRARRLLPRVPDLAAALASTPTAGDLAARAIMTTDTRPKTAVRSAEIGGKRGTVAGVAKGAGMIHPRLATMLCVLFTDFSVPGAVLQQALQQAVKTSFNAISVDGDTSPNDSVILLATGDAGELAETDDIASFVRLLASVCEDLAEMIVRDAEGATKFIEIDVSGAASELDADRIACAVATSPLVKTAFYGADFNPGRILSAIGRSGADVRFDRLTLSIGDLPVFGGGRFLAVESEAARSVMRANDVTVAIDAGAGRERLRFFTCDLTPEYVRINGDYTT